jgi:hypothetical protein
MRKPFKFQFLIALICFSSIMVISRHHEGHALRNDPALHGLCGADCQTSGLPVLGPSELQAFEGLTRVYGLALAPLILSPANTIGINATEAEFSFSSVMLTDDANSWVNGINATVAPTSLSATRFVLRKGLPYSFEIDGQLGYLINSELWSMGGGVKWALHEAMSSFPVDFSIRGGVNRILGSSQIDLTSVSFGASLGTQFGVMRLYNLAPYVSYNPVMIFAGSTTLDATPGLYDPVGNSANNTAGNTGSTAFVFPRREEVVHRVGVGVRFLFGVLRITPEYAWTPHQQNINVSLGLQL